MIRNHSEKDFKGMVRGNSEDMVARQLLMVNLSYLIMVVSCCYATTIIDAWP